MLDPRRDDGTDRGVPDQEQRDRLDAAEDPGGELTDDFDEWHCLRSMLRWHHCGSLEDAAFHSDAIDAVRPGGEIRMNTP